MGTIKIKTFMNIGIDGYEVFVEADSNRSLPTIEIIGLVDASIKESKERLRFAFRNIGFELPNRKIVLNLSPSEFKKSGSRFDLPMTVAILTLLNEGNLRNTEYLESALFFGELGLDGGVKKVPGILPSVLSAVSKGYDTFFIPYDNLFELSFISGIKIFPLKNFSDLYDFFVYGKQIEVFHGDLGSVSDSNLIRKDDFLRIKGHDIIKHALIVAVSGMHNVLLVGPPGSGKSLLSKSLSSIMPNMTMDEIIQVSKIYSLCGLLSKGMPLVMERPFRSVHSSCSKASLIGGGIGLLPGELSLAHLGVLFMDEIAEFPKDILDSLRQPMEDKKIVISRVSGSVEYPSNFMLVGAMNPCKCGYYNDVNLSCKCTLNDVKRYQSRLSGPLLDRFDMILDVPRISLDLAFDSDFPLDMSNIVDLISNAILRQSERFKNTDYYFNSHVSSKDLSKYMKLDEKCEEFLKSAMKSLSLSMRVIHRTIRLARTIADISNLDNIDKSCLAQAMHYRSRNLFINNEK